MPATKQKAEIDGLTFTRWHHTANKPGSSMSQALADEDNAAEPWMIELSVTSGETGEMVGLQVTASAWAEEIGMAGGPALLTPGDARRLSLALRFAAALIGQMNDGTRCQNHGGELGADGCPACAAEYEAFTVAAHGQSEARS